MVFTRRRGAIILTVALVLGSAVAALQRRGEGHLVAVEPIVTWTGPSGPASGAATARFVLRNTGAKAVRVTSTESGCGCAEPKVEPELIPAGGIAVIDVRATSVPVGIKNIPITVRCDSPSSPELSLNLRLVGTRTPPFVFKVTGDLVFLGDSAVEAHRRLTVVTVEPEGQAGEPLVTSDVPYLKIEREETRTVPYRGVGTVQRQRSYTVRLATRPPTDAFSGRVLVEDPWNAGADGRFAVNVIGRLSPSAMKAVPPALRLSL